MGLYVCHMLHLGPTFTLAPIFTVVSEKVFPITLILTVPGWLGLVCIAPLALNFSRTLSKWLITSRGSGLSPVDPIWIDDVGMIER